MLQFIRNWWRRPIDRIALTVKQVTCAPQGHPTEEVVLQTTLPAESDLLEIYHSIGKLGGAAAKRNYDLNGDVLAERDFERELERKAQAEKTGVMPSDVDMTKIDTRLLQKLEREQAMDKELGADNAGS